MVFQLTGRFAEFESAIIRGRMGGLRTPGRLWRPGTRPKVEPIIRAAWQSAKGRGNARRMPATIPAQRNFARSHRHPWRQSHGSARRNDNHRVRYRLASVFPIRHFIAPPTVRLPHRLPCTSRRREDRPAPTPARRTANRTGSETADMSPRRFAILRGCGLRSQSNQSRPPKPPLSLGEPEPDAPRKDISSPRGAMY